MSKYQGVDQRRQVVLAGYRNAVGELQAAFENGDESHRSSALGGLARSGALTGDDARRGTLDAAPRVRRRVASLLAVMHDGIEASDRIELLSALGRDLDDSVVEVACFAAGELDMTTHKLVSQLVSIGMDHTDPLCRESAVAALGSLGDPDGWPAIEHGCHDVPAIRRRAVLALVAFDHDRANELLHELTNDHDWQVRQAAEDLLSIEGSDDASEAGPNGPTSD